MNWYGTSGTGSQSAAGNRASDADSMCGNAIMYDAVAGKILTLGGSPNYVSKYNRFGCRQHLYFLPTLTPWNYCPSQLEPSQLYLSRCRANGDRLLLHRQCPHHYARRTQHNP